MDRTDVQTVKEPFTAAVLAFFSFLLGAVFSAFGATKRYGFKKYYQPV